MLGKIKLIRKTENCLSGGHGNIGGQFNDLWQEIRAKKSGVGLTLCRCFRIPDHAHISNGKAGRAALSIKTR